MKKKQLGEREIIHKKNIEKNRWDNGEVKTIEKIEWKEDRKMKIIAILL